MEDKPTAKQYYEAFKKSYPKLRDALPIQDLLPDFFKTGVVSRNLKERLNSIPARSEKVMYLLDEIERGLNAEIIDQFESFICVMEKFGNDNKDIVAKKLAEDIRLTMSEATVKQPSSSVHLSSTDCKVPGRCIWFINECTSIHQSVCEPCFNFMYGVMAVMVVYDVIYILLLLGDRKLSHMSSYMLYRHFLSSLSTLLINW